MKFDGLTIELERTLSEYSEEENEKLRKCLKKAALNCKADLKNTTPRSSSNDKHLADGWRIKKNESRGSCEYTIYNVTKPGLTHLLEKGHLIKNQYGEYERYTEHVGFMKTAEEKAKEELIDLLVNTL